MIGNMSLLIDLHFLPSLEYFCALEPYEKIFVEKHEHFVKQSFRSRCYLNTSQGVESLVVPLTSKHGKVPVKDVKIDYSQRWQSIHWRTLGSAYRKSAFYEHFAPDLNRILLTPHTFLFDLNSELLSFCLTSLGWQKEISETACYEEQSRVAVSDLRSVITPKKNYTTRDFYRPVPYYQVFGSTFVPNLSIVDLLFNMGPQAAGLIRSSRGR